MLSEKGSFAGTAGTQSDCTKLEAKPNWKKHDWFFLTSTVGEVELQQLLEVFPTTNKYLCFFGSVYRIQKKYPERLVIFFGFKNKELNTELNYQPY